MSHNNLFNIVLGSCLVVSLLIGGITDSRSRRLPNLLTMSMLLAGLLLHALQGGQEGLLFSLKGALTGFAFLFLVYVLGGTGAGDVKFMGGVGALLGPEATQVAIVFIALTGGIFAVLVMMQRKAFREQLRSVGQALWLTGSGAGLAPLRPDRQTLLRDGIPYGVVIALGTIASLVWRTIVSGEII